MAALTPDKESLVLLFYWNVLRTENAADYHPGPVAPSVA